MSPTSYLTAPPRDTGGIIGSAIVWVKQELVEGQTPAEQPGGAHPPN
jgi:hypothetical protein